MRILILLPIVFLLGCASVGTPIDHSKLGQIRKGESTQADVEQLLGKPSQLSSVDGKEGKQVVLSYVHAHSQVHRKSH